MRAAVLANVRDSLYVGSIYFQDDRPVARKRFLAGGRRTLGRIHEDAFKPEHFPEPYVGKIGDVLRGRESGLPPMTRCSQVTSLKSCLLNTPTIQRGSGQRFVFNCRARSQAA